MNLFEVYTMYPQEIVHGEGWVLRDNAGKEYLDFYGGHGVISIGHRHPHWVKSIGNQLQHLGFYSNIFPNSLQRQVADKLGELSGCQEYALFLCNSGAEANENALKLASFHTNRPKILAFEKSFHGRTSGAVAATHNPSIASPFNAGHQVSFLPLNDFDKAGNALRDTEVAAVIVEGIQGVGGLDAPDSDFLHFLQEECRKNGVLLVLDEVQSGYGRTGRFFAYQHAGIQPDLVTIAKGMGNGFPVAGVLVAPHIEARLGSLGSTFGGNHLACAAALSVLEVIEAEALVEKAAQMGAYAEESWGRFKGIASTKGKGLMLGLEFDFPVAGLRRDLLDNGLVTGGSSNPNLLRILPPLTIDRAALDQATELIFSTLPIPAKA